MTEQLGWQFNKDWDLARNVAEVLARFAKRFGVAANFVILHIDHKGVEIDGIEVEWTTRNAQRNLVYAGYKDVLASPHS